jgi:hypothetical protein
LSAKTTVVGLGAATTSRVACFGFYLRNTGFSFEGFVGPLFELETWISISGEIYATTPEGARAFSGGTRCAAAQRATKTHRAGSWRRPGFSAELIGVTDRGDHR